MTKILLLSAFLATSAFAQTKPAPPLPDAAIARYWRAIAAHHAQDAAIQGSLTAKQKQMQESLVQIDAQIASERKQLAEACEAAKATLDESGADPVCVLKPEAPAK
jgi:Skp family chaperone for outer membrane proteins